MILLYFQKALMKLSRALADFNLSNRRVCIVSESRVAGFYMEALKEVFRPVAREVIDFVFPEGEASEKHRNTGAKALRKTDIWPILTVRICWWHLAAAWWVI